MKNIVTHVLAGLALSSAGVAEADYCPTPPTRIEPKVTVKVDRDPKSQNYIYRYTLSNDPGSQLPIDMFVVRFMHPPVRVSTPPGWVGNPHSDNGTFSHFTWATSFSTNWVGAGSSKSGFEIESPDKPGLVQFYSLGRTGTPTATATAEDDEPMPECDGFFEGLPLLETLVAGATQGPSPDGQVSADIELKDAQGIHAFGVLSPYEDKGMLNVLLKGGKELDPSVIDLSSLRFGVGKAPLEGSRILGSSNNILLQFKIEKTSIECGRDRILFLTGKTKDGRALLGATPVQLKNCERRPKRAPFNHVKLKDVLEMKKKQKQFPK